MKERTFNYDGFPVRLTDNGDSYYELPSQFDGSLEHDFRIEGQGSVPKKATVTIESETYLPDTHREGVDDPDQSHYLVTTPSGTFWNSFWKPKAGTEPRVRKGNNHNFLGYEHVIHSDGTFYPPELRENLRFAQEVLGYEISPEVWKVMGLTGQAMNQIAS